MCECVGVIEGVQIDKKVLGETKKGLFGVGFLCTFQMKEDDKQDMTMKKNIIRLFGE